MERPCDEAKLEYAMLAVTFLIIHISVFTFVFSLVRL